MIKKILGLLGATAAAAFGLQAQVTTSTLSGMVHEGKEPVAGVTVLAIHEPTGTTHYTYSSEDGSYILTGLQSGGPYTVTFSLLGYEEQTAKDITLDLGEATHLDATLKAEEIGRAHV